MGYVLAKGVGTNDVFLSLCTEYFELLNACTYSGARIFRDYSSGLRENDQ